MKCLPFISLLLVLASCGVTRPVTQITRDMKVVEHTELIPTLVFVEIPYIKDSVVTLDTLSHLENDYAVSDAKVSRQGLLSHSLATKPHSLSQTIETPVIYRDSIVAVKEYVTKEVPAKLSKWQRVQIKGFWGLSLFLFVLAFLKMKR